MPYNFCWEGGSNSLKGMYVEGGGTCKVNRYEQGEGGVPKIQNFE